MTGSFERVVQLVDQSGHPIGIADVLIDITIFIRNHTRYRFNLGSTDESGQLKFSSEDIERFRLRGQESAVMDYNTSLSECDQRVLLTVPDESERIERLQALQKWFPEETDTINRIERMQSLIRCQDVAVDLSQPDGGTVRIPCAVETDDSNDV